MVGTGWFDMMSICCKIVFGYLKELIIDKFILKFIVGLATGYMSVIYVGNEEAFHIICWLFIINWFLGTLKALRYKTFNHDRFYQGIYKVVAIFILLYIGYAADAVLPYDYFFTGIMFGFIAMNDISHIIRHIEDLGFNIIPGWFTRIIQVHKNKFVIDKIKDVTGYDISNKYLDDMSMIETYIDNIPDLVARKLFKIKIVYLKRIVMELVDVDISDIHTYRMKMNLLFTKVGGELELAIKKSGESEENINCFWRSHTERYIQLMQEIESIIDGNESKVLDKEQLRQIKENILQTIIRVIYRNISDKYNLKN